MGSATWHPPSMRTADIEGTIEDLIAADDTEGLLYEALVEELARRTDRTKKD